MLHLIDGYNITRADPATAASTLEEQREALVTRLRVRGAELLGAGRVVVVFDGAGGAGVSRHGVHPVEVRFSRAGSADDEIVSIARRTKGRIRLVTSDTDLAQRVRGAATDRVEVVGRETLFESTSGRRGGKRGVPYPASTVGLPKGANRITEELKKLWLDDEE